jgi:hypothetical protein
MPVQRTVFVVGFYPVPPFRMPVGKIGITARLHKLEEFSVGNKGRGYAVRRQVHFVAIQFIIETKPVAGMTDLVHTFFY